MSKDQQLSMPGVFGGLMRYNEEYKSKFMINPAYAIGAVIAFGVFILMLNLFLK
jgi:preprotein translocase subunit Sec61beta